MKVMALDLGTKSCGVAVSDPSGTLARALKNLHYPDLVYAALSDDILALAEKEKVEEIVIGYPITLSGEVKTQAKQAKRLKKILRQKSPLNVVLFDERFTTKLARHYMDASGLSKKQKDAEIDQFSAAILLQDYLQSKGSV